MVESTQRQSATTEPGTLRPLDQQGQRDAESRLDPITGQWTIFAPHRGNRPDEFVQTGETIYRQLECPFCSGNEASTPPAVWVGKIDDGLCRTSTDESKAVDETATDWSVRVVPNRYPAVDRPQSYSPRQTESPLFSSGPIVGGHEVFIESRQHVTSLTQLDLSEVQLTFLAYRDRLKFWRTYPGISYISIFKNVGEKAGASLRHCHSQLIATDQIPSSIETSITRMDRHRAEMGCCLQCDLIRAEQKAKRRIVWRDDTVVAFCPFASRLPMLLRITTQQHQAHFEELDDLAIESVSRLVYRSVSWLEAIRPGTPYNICLSTKPPGAGDSTDSFHWSIDLFPRMTQLAGFEWSSGCMINPVLPETAAASYRRIAIAEDPRTIS